MTFADKLNLFLLVINSNFAIVTTFLLISAAIYIVWQAHQHHMSWKDWAVNVPLGVAVAAPLFVEHLGNLIVRGTIWIWRLLGADEPLDRLRLVLIGIGSTIGLVGVLLLIRSVSRPRFGEKMWLSALGCAAINTTITVYLFM